MRQAPLPADHSLDFAVLQQPTRRQAERSRWALLWLLGLLLLVVGSVVMLVLYLHTFETQEEQRQRSADVQWLEQSVQFHFRRLEDDLTVLARQATQRADRPVSRQVRKQVNPQVDQRQAQGVKSLEVQGGLLWREPGVVLAHGWMAFDNPRTKLDAPGRWVSDWSAQASNAELLTTLQDTSRGLRRAAYAGPMRRADGTLSDVVWLAVPFFDRGQFVGNYLAAIAMDSAAQTLVPDWFEKHQKVRLVVEGVQDVQGLTTGLQDAHRYRAFMNLPGTDLFLEVSPRHAQPATVPRLFFAVALLFLLGMLVSLYALRRDFSKRQRIQVLLQAEVALRCAMENSVAVGLRAWDMDGKILYVNEAFCRMVGYEAGVLVGQSAPLPYWPAEQAHALLQLHRDIIAQGTRSEGAQTQFQHSDGHLVDVLIHEAPLNTADGTQIGWMSSVQDISERKRAQRVAAVQQEKLEASGRLVTVGEVASTLAHELNQPLGALSSFAAGLLNRLRDGTIAQEEVAPVIARIAALADKAGRIIQHVNAFARRRELSLQRLDLMDVLRRVLPDSVERHVRHLHLVDQGAPIWILADAMLLEHLIGNLVGNALDWANHGVVQPQVRVEVLCDATQGMAALVVADSGPGVQQPDQTHIFNAFFSTKEGGMGMGLAICRSIAEAHHGRIEVGRDEVLGGARFTAWFPLADAAVPALSLEKTQ